MNKLPIFWLTYFFINNFWIITYIFKFFNNELLTKKIILFILFVLPGPG